MNQMPTKGQSQRGAGNLPPRMKAALEQYKKRVWTIKLAEGVLAAIFGILVSYIIVFCLDRVFDTPTLLRVLILVIGMVGMVFLLPMEASAIGGCCSVVATKVSAFWGSRARHCGVST